MRPGLQAKRAVEIRGMFGRIARRYDLLNRILSVGRDAAWRRVLSRRVKKAEPEVVLDVCTGTGDVALGLCQSATTIASDFCLPMLVQARKKVSEAGCRMPLFAADALRLPLTDDCVDVVTVAFGVRNFENLEAGLGELVRVLGPGGTLLVLEFSRPRGLLGPVLRWWARVVPPRVGAVISGDSEAYTYLPDSVSVFPDGGEMGGILTKCGVTGVFERRLTGGVATLYEGCKPAPTDGAQTARGAHDGC